MWGWLLIIVVFVLAWMIVWMTGQKKQLEGQKKQLEGREKQLTGQKKQLEGQKKQLEGREKQLTGQKKQLEGQKQQLEGYEKQLTGQKKQLEGQKQQLEGYEKQLTGQKKQLEEQTKQLKEHEKYLEKYLEEREKQLTGHKEQLEGQKKQLEEHEKYLEGREKQLEGILGKSEEKLNILKEGVEKWNVWREENQGVEITLNHVNLSYNSLEEVNLRNANLRDANLSNANLRNANLRDANLSNANLSNANLSSADLRRVQAIETSFEGVNLTGACIQDWNINSETNLDSVSCDYIYLNSKYQNGKLIYIDRRPSDPSKDFEPREFAQLVQKSIETVDLIFREELDWQHPNKTIDLYFQHGIEWEALANSIKCMTDDGTFLDIERIDQTNDGGIVIRVKIQENTDKEEIEREFWEKYKAELKQLEGTYQEQLQRKDEKIEILYKQHNTTLTDIIHVLGGRQINNINTLEAKMTQNDSRVEIHNGDYINDSEFGATRLNARDNAKVAHTINEAQQHNLASAAKEIQDLLDQLSETYPTTTLSEKSAVAEKAIAQIKSDENWLGKVVRIIKAMGKEAFFETIDHPAANVLRAGFEEFLSD